MSRPAASLIGRPFAALLDRTIARREPPWLARRRGEAHSRFETLGLPRPGDEDWRQTNVQPLGTIPFVPAQAAELAPGALDEHPVAALSPIRLVLVNGRFDPRTSSLDGLPDGVRAMSLRTALLDAPEAIEPYLGAIAANDDQALAALNLSSFDDGAVIVIAPNVSLKVPIHVLHAVTANASPVVASPRTLIVAGTSARATIIESFVTLGAGTTLTNAVTEIALDENARIDHVKVQAESEEAWHVAMIVGRVARDARLASHNLSWGGRLTRNDIGARLDGEGASCHLYGLYIADGVQHVDNHTWLDHASAHCPSWEMYKGVLAGSAKAVFNGRIIVREGAQKTDAKQSNKNLILANGATIFTRPQLEIYANDVKCTHGATIGRLDETALFYLRSRGLGAIEARDLLVHAFADDVLAKIPDETARRILGAALYARLERDLAG